MSDVAKIVSWKNSKDLNFNYSIAVNADSAGIESQIKKAIIEALNNEYKPVMLSLPVGYSMPSIIHNDWSSFGKDGDYIIVEDVEIFKDL